MSKKKSEIQTYRLLVGTVVLYIGIAIAVGDFVSAGLLIVASFVCTLGLGGLIWFPCSWLVGFCILYLINSIRRKSFLPEPVIGSFDTPVNETTPIPVVSNDVLAIAQYILKSRKRNASDTQITTRLKQTGWTEKEIELAFAYVNGAPSP
ncbi:hypothetical protein Lepto7376_2131 [[Leptolyngbya] sp. PCC 7376]|uniref:hypothetical protein n=1 Tax=[Leptolyngbya] sp. PCC 7376 TaxID=111781 RepID=UPI00029ECC21|nr:hypothetical protein [[Leptolyngbya] sp. PCC 7376]AFY38429.1 hypothetical protein Lepto7376_2131 [[Leptolyngbya] sp. PCC 7376]